MCIHVAYLDFLTFLYSYFISLLFIFVPLYLSNPLACELVYWQWQQSDSDSNTRGSLYLNKLSLMKLSGLFNVFDWNLLKILWEYHGNDWMNLCVILPLMETDIISQTPLCSWCLTVLHPPPQGNKPWGNTVCDCGNLCLSLIMWLRK